MSESNRRRSDRVQLTIPLRMKGSDEAGLVFDIPVHTTSLNRDGSLHLQHSSFVYWPSRPASQPLAAARGRVSSGRPGFSSSGPRRGMGRRVHQPHCQHLGDQLSARDRSGGSQGAPGVPHVPRGGHDFTLACGSGRSGDFRHPVETLQAVCGEHSLGLPGKATVHGSATGRIWSAIRSPPSCHRAPRAPSTWKNTPPAPRTYS